MCAHRVLVDADRVTVRDDRQRGAGHLREVVPKQQRALQDAPHREVSASKVHSAWWPGVIHRVEHAIANFHDIQIVEVAVAGGRDGGVVRERVEPGVHVNQRRHAAPGWVDIVAHAPQVAMPTRRDRADIRLRLDREDHRSPCGGNSSLHRSVVF